MDAVSQAGSRSETAPEKEQEQKSLSLRSELTISTMNTLISADALASAPPPEVANLMASHESLMKKVHRKAHVELEDTHKAAGVVKTFAAISMTKPAAWITSATCFLIIKLSLEVPHNGVEDHRSGPRELLARVIYAVAASIVVPLIEWMLLRTSRVPKAPGKSVTFLEDQVDLMRLCLPMMLGWAWKDVVGEAMDIAGRHGFPYILLVVVEATTLAAVVQISPCYRRAIKAIKCEEGGYSLHRVPALFGRLDVAAGFAWSEAFKWELNKLVDAHLVGPSGGLFILMVWAVYFLAISVAVVALTARYKPEPERNEQSPAIKRSNALDELEMRAPAPAEERVMSVAARNIFLNTLRCTYGWALRDCIRAFFFIYLLGCDDPESCGHDKHFYLAIIVSIVFAHLSIAMQQDKPKTKWDKASKSLQTAAFSLSAGGIWVGFCKAAMDHEAKTSIGGELVFHILCVAFAWLCISLLHRRFQLVHRARDGQCKEVAEAYGITLQ